MFSKKMEKSLNQQVNAELYSSYLYLSMSAYFSEINLAGCAHWMRLQAQEELLHGLKIYDYINERGGRALLASIEAPPQKWDSPVAVFENVLAHEQKVTGMINKLVDQAISEKDHATNNFLQWFVAEQVEEEASANEALQKMRLAAKEGGLFILDQELARRVLTPAA
ncbi:ferritin [Desulfurivibrio sp. D14AmB]|uniref:ferritin n=1 Tax=Desulfurivibrio sp. D14AmB TaxID=3374370 RepID=UPI00376F12AE